MSDIVVQANDHKFYANPRWIGFKDDTQGNRYRWLLNYFDDAFILTFEGDKDNVHLFLEGWPVKLKRGSKTKHAIFPPDWSFVHGYRFPLEFTWAPPRPTEGEPRSWAPMDNLNHCWYVPFATRDVHAYVLGKAAVYNSQLNKFLSDGIYGNTKVKRVRTALRKQFKAMHGLTQVQAIEQYGESVEVCRTRTASKSIPSS